MRLTPAQIAVTLICGQRLPPFGEARIAVNATLAERISIGRNSLVQISGKDFGYDLAAWHEYLKQSRMGGYTWARNIVMPRIMQKALNSNAWNEAVQSLRAKHLS